MTPSPSLPSPSPWRARRLLLTLAAALPLLAAACGGDSEYAITDVRRTVPPSASGAETASWGYRLPDGWEVLPPAPMRELGFEVAGREDATCTFAILPGTGGGLAANVNRWRKQMSLDPLTEDQIAELPRRRFLGEESVEVDLEGTYVGMGGTEPIEKARMFGLIVVVEQASAFLKMVGPADVVAAERQAFDRLQLSLLPPGTSSGDMPPGHPPTGPAATPPGPMGDLPPGHPPMGQTPPPPASATPSRLKWKAPEGWVEQGPRQMREVTFQPAGASAAECYISILGGMGGGMAANINRWRQQMGKPALSDAEISALPTADVLGGRGVFVTVSEGDFSGDTGEQVEGAALLGFILERPDDWVFVKMRGPAMEVLPEQANFEAFCKSLTE
jgi:hypothetical protein